MIAISTHSGTDINIRILWATEVIKHFAQDPRPHDSIRPWDFLAQIDGSVELLASPSSESNSDKVYPSRFQIPRTFLEGLNGEERVRRMETFAMASLLYEIMSGAHLFDGLPDDEVQLRFSKNEFPEDAVSLPYSLFILSGWSGHSPQEIERQCIPGYSICELQLTFQRFRDEEPRFLSSDGRLYQGQSRKERNLDNKWCSRYCPGLGSDFTGRSRILSSRTRSRYFGSILAVIDWGGSGWQPFCMVPKCSNGRNRVRWASSRGNCWHGIN